MRQVSHIYVKFGVLFQEGEGRTGTPWQWRYFPAREKLG